MYKAKEKLLLSPEGKIVRAEGVPTNESVRHTLLVEAGGELSDEDAARYGLEADEEGVTKSDEVEQPAPGLTIDAEGGGQAMKDALISTADPEAKKKMAEKAEKAEKATQHVTKKRGSKPAAGHVTEAAKK